MGAPPISSGSGTGSPGGPATPMQREIEASAWTEVNKAALAIVHDTIDLSFTQIDLRYSSSHLGTQTGYKARENQPMLDHYIDTERSLLSSNTARDTSAALYEDLVDQLTPPEFKAEFLQEMSKPIGERSSNFTAMDNMLKATAQTLVQIHSASQTPGPDSLEAARTALNSLGSLLAFRGAMHVGSDIFDAASSYMKAAGPNHPHFDEQSGYLNQLSDILDDLKSVDLPALAQQVNEAGKR